MPANAPLFKGEIYDVRIGVCMHRVKLVLLCACILTPSFLLWINPVLLCAYELQSSVSTCSDHSSSKRYVLQTYLYKASWHYHYMF